MIQVVLAFFTPLLNVTEHGKLDNGRHMVGFTNKNHPVIYSVYMEQLKIHMYTMEIIKRDAEMHVTSAADITHIHIFQMFPTNTLMYIRFMFLLMQTCYSSLISTKGYHCTGSWPPRSGLLCDSVVQVRQRGFSLPRQSNTVISLN